MDIHVRTIMDAGAPRIQVQFDNTIVNNFDNIAKIIDANTDKQSIHINNLFKIINGYKIRWQISLKIKRY